MRLSEYTLGARATAIYRQDRVFEYPSLGIGGEIGELLGKLDAVSLELDPVPIRKEVGDVLWYVANTSEDAQIGMESLFEEDLSFADIQAVAPPISPLKLASFAGEACELAKKYIRDDDSVMSEERRAKVKTNLRNILLGLGSMCNRLGLSLEEAATENLAKLLSRKERGVLQGSGDNR